MAGQQPDLSVICKSCGSEVSPYVTECPYCGTRLRKRAPRIERVGDDIRIDVEGLRVPDAPPEAERRRRMFGRRRAGRGRRKERRRPRIGAPTIDLDRSKPWPLIFLVVAPAVLLIVQRAAGLSPTDVGALVTAGLGDGLGSGGEWWRYLAAPWVYFDPGYVVVIGAAVLILGIGLSSRIGMPATLALLIACGSLGMVAADAVESGTVAAGGNGAALGLLAAWFMLARREEHAYEEDEPDLILVAVAALVLMAIPLVESTASPTAAIAGGLVGLAAGAITASRRARTDGT